MRGATDKASILAHANVVNISAAAVIVEGDKILVIKEINDGEAAYNFPSGKAHLDELIEQTAKREAMEEAGYPIELTDVVSIYYYRTKGNSNDRKKDRITIRFNFWCKKTEALPQQKPTKETISVEWVTREELRALISQGVFRNWISRQLAEDVLANKKFPLSAVQQFKR